MNRLRKPGSLLLLAFMTIYSTAFQVHLYHHWVHGANTAIEAASAGVQSSGSGAALSADLAPSSLQAGTASHSGGHCRHHASGLSCSCHALSFVAAPEFDTNGPLLDQGVADILEPFCLSKLVCRNPAQPPRVA